jgi:hypothetical protein
MAGAADKLLGPALDALTMVVNVYAEYKAAVAEATRSTVADSISTLQNEVTSYIQEITETYSRTLSDASSRVSEVVVESGIDALRLLRFETILAMARSAANPAPGDGVEVLDDAHADKYGGAKAVLAVPLQVLKDAVQAYSAAPSPTPALELEVRNAVLRLGRAEYDLALGFTQLRRKAGGTAEYRGLLIRLSPPADAVAPGTKLSGAVTVSTVTPRPTFSPRTCPTRRRSRVRSTAS